jgi:hypothetical protein
MHRALARIHVEHDTVGAIVSLRDELAIHGHQAEEVLLAGQELRLEPVQRRGQCGATVPHFGRPDQTKRRIDREPCRVVEVFVSSQPAVHRLSHEIGEAELRIQPVARIRQVLRDERSQAEALIQFPNEHQAGV